MRALARGASGLSLVGATLLGCERPPEAPEGLDESTRYLLREFYGDHSTLGAGLSGLMSWYESDGVDLLDRSATLDTSADFTLAPLGADDVAHLDVVGDPDPALAEGTIAVSSLTCAWPDAEALLVRGDQDHVFDGKWSEYERTYISDRAAYEGARTEDSFPALPLLDPASEDFPTTAEAPGVLLTENAVGTDEVGVQLNYTLVLHFRHGVFTVGEEERRATVILSWQPERADGASGTNSLEQVYSVEVLIEEGAGTLRFVATWNQVISELLGDDEGNILVTTAVNRMKAFAGRMSEICDGTIVLEAEAAR